MSREQIIGLLGPDWDRALSMMREQLRSDVLLLNEVNDSLLKHSGKLLRPMTSLLIAKALGGVSDDSVKLAVASEILHNATLIHDDVADESSERRGQPTVSSLIGPTNAVLVGDFWLSRAVEIVFGTSCYNKAANFFCKTLSDLSEGEMLQLEKSRTADTVEDDYFRIIYCKTASLFRTACVAAALSVGASERETGMAAEYGTALGTAFQIKDDILDYAGTSELGKPLGVDLKEKKITIPLLGAMKMSPESSDRIREKVRNMDSDPRNYEDVHRFVIENGGIEYATGVLEEYIEKAVRTVRGFNDSEAVEALVEIARYNTMRQV